MEKMTTKQIHFSNNSIDMNKYFEIVINLYYKIILY